MTLAEVYPAVKSLHVGLAITSGGLFAGRGIGVLMGAAMPTSRRMRRLSQAIDSLLLVAALILLAILGLNPVTTPWLAAKLVLLVAYIVLGILALRVARTRAGKAVAFVAALGCFVLMFAIARTHDPLGPLRALGLV